MKPGIHPNYLPAMITCACGATYPTHSTAGSFSIEICSACHPFFTGKQKLIDSEGRVDRFRRMYGIDKEQSTLDSLKARIAAAKSGKA